MRIQQRFAVLRQSVKHQCVIAILSAAASLFGMPATAQSITIASPVNSTAVPAGVWVRAHNVSCSGLPPVAFAYSVDSSGSLTFGVTPYDIDTVDQNIGPGTHTIFYKAWTTSGICPVVSTTFNVIGPGAPSASAPAWSGTPANVPGYAYAYANLDTAGNWQYEHDGGTPGWAQGSTVFPATTPSSDTGREFYMEYSNNGGERWHLSIGNNGTAANFALDTYIYVTDPSQVQNLELDLNQVMSNGETVIYGTQCSSISNTWEYTYVSSNSPHWKPSNIPCNPRSWSANSWHHVQIGFHRDGNGVVTHDWVNLDGSQSYFSNATAGGGLWLGWAVNALLINYQVDGYLQQGSSATYIHNMKVYSW